MRFKLGFLGFWNLRVKERYRGKVRKDYIGIIFKDISEIYLFILMLFLVEGIK